MQLLQIDNEIELGCVAHKVNTFVRYATKFNFVVDLKQLHPCLLYTSDAADE